MTAPINITFTPGTTITTEWCNGVNDHVNDLETGAHTAANITNVPSVGLVATNVQDALDELASNGVTYTSVLAYGAVGNGTTDDTTAIQNAINAVGASGGGVVYFPSGTYKITSALTLSNSNVSLLGENRQSSVIKQFTNNAKILSITGNQTTVSNLGFDYNTTPVSGATAIYCYGSSCSFENFYISKAYVGMEFDSGVANFVTAFEIHSYVSIGIFAHDLNDLFVSDFIMNAENATNGALGGIRLFNKVEAFVCSNGDIIQGVYNLTSDADSNTIRERPAGNKFSNVYFDSAYTNNVYLNNTVDTEFNNCWFSYAGANYAGSPNLTGVGIYLGGTDDIRFNGGEIVNCYAQGLTIGEFAFRTSLIGVSVRDNSLGSANTYSGVVAEANSLAFTIIGCCLGSTEDLFSSTTQKYGLEIKVGTSDYFIVQNNLCLGNGTAGIVNGATGTEYILKDNVGYKTANKGSSHIVSGNTEVTVIHGLGIIPPVAGILITSASAMGSNPFYVDTTSITSTTFKVKTASAVGADSYFIWQATTQGN